MEITLKKEIKINFLLSLLSYCLIRTPLPLKCFNLKVYEKSSRHYTERFIIVLSKTNDKETRVGMCLKSIFSLVFLPANKHKNSWTDRLNEFRVNF